MNATAISKSAVIEGYSQFGGIHWETASLRNVLAHKGLLAPHDGNPLTEAMLLGIGGGVSVMYFVFEYEGYPPSLYIGTRYHDDLMGSACKRLGVPAKVQETTSREKALANLLTALEAGHPTIAWANMAGLSYNALLNAPYPVMMPVVVYGYSETDGVAYIADRAPGPLACTTRELDEARAAQGSLKHRLMTLHPPDRVNDLSSAMREGISTCAQMMLDGPSNLPKFKGNFGLSALLKWADLMVDAKDKKSWAKAFTPGAKLYAGMVGAFKFIETWGTGGGASRPMYADFLDEAGSVLGQADLQEAATLFRTSGTLWNALAKAALPDAAPLLRETRDLLLRKHRLFTEQGMDAAPELMEIEISLTAIEAAVAAEFPMSEREVVAWREEMRERILSVHDAEREAVLALEEIT